MLVVLLSACSGGGGGGTNPVTAVDDSYAIGQGQTLSVGGNGVLGNDSTTSGSLTASVASQPTHGTLTFNANGSFTYKHDGVGGQTDSFTYRASNGSASAMAAVTITISPPIANNDAYVVTGPGQSLVVLGGQGVLANDDGAPLAAVLVTPPAHHAGGAFTLNSDGSFTYNHDGVGIADSFTYRATGGGHTSGLATVNISINQPPVATTACVSTPSNYVAGTIVTGTLPATDPEGGQLQYSIPVANVSLKGTATTDVSGNFVYQPTNAGVVGADKFTYTATDNKGLQSTGVAWVFIGGTNNNPPPALRIMPLGDSITAGITAVPTPNDPPASERVGYRRKLYSDLVTLANGKYLVDFVGQYSEGLFASPPVGDPNHQGTPGQNAAQLASQIQSYLNANKADILLLHIGTNDFTTDATDVETILNNIDTWESANFPVTVFLARIIKDAQSPFLDVQTFNDNVAAMLAGRPADRVILVNQQTGALINYTVGVDMASDLHPNDSGYEKMAAKWYSDMFTTAPSSKYLGLPQCP